MVVGQLVTAMVMVMTSVHLRHHHALPPSPWCSPCTSSGCTPFSVVSGRLADRWGRVPVITGGAAAGAGSLGGGALFAAAGFAAMALAAALLARGPLGLTWWRMATRQVAADASTA